MNKSKYTQMVAKAVAMYQEFGLPEMLRVLLDYIDISHCPCCGETENLVSGPAANGGTLYMCQAAAREALSRGE